MQEKSVWSSKAYWIPVLAATALAYPKFLTTYIVGIDDLKPGYVDDGILHGRPTNVISNWLLFPDKNVIQPFANIFGFILLVLGVTALCAFWQRLAPKKLRPLALGMFSALFITYPMTYELTSYNNLIITAGEGLLLIAAALACLHRFETQNQKRDFLLAVLCLGLSVGGYESHAALYITLVIATLWLEWETAAAAAVRVRDQLRRAVPYALALGGGLVFKWLLGNAMALALRGQPATGNGANNFGWDLRHLGATAAALIKGTAIAYGAFVLEYLPLGILWLAILFGLLRLFAAGGGYCFTPGPCRRLLSGAHRQRVPAPSGQRQNRGVPCLRVYHRGLCGLYRLAVPAAGLPQKGRKNSDFCLRGVSAGGPVP